MSVVAITASRTSPGATTLAAGLAIAWSHLAERALLVEADPAGGVLALRFDMAPSPSLTTFASDVRNKFEADLVWANTQDLRGAHCMPAPVDPRLARSWIERISTTLIDELPRLGAPTVIDLGWVDEAGASASLVKAADTTLIVTSPDMAEIQGLMFQVRRLQDQGAQNIQLVTVGSSPTQPDEIAAVAGIPLAAVLPHDPHVASALAGASFKPNKFRRSLLWRTISGLADALFDPQLMTHRATPVTAEPQYPAPTGSPQPAAPQPVTPVAAPEPTPAGAAAPQPVAAQPAAPQPVAAQPAAPQPIPAAIVSDAQPATQSAPDFVDPGLFEDTKRLPLEQTAALVMANGTRTELDVDAASLIGRHNSCSISLDDDQVSRRHGRLTLTAQGWHYADLGSRNGSLINNLPSLDALLVPGDVVTVGRTQLTFELTSTREMECA